MLKYIESFDHIGAGLAGTDLALYTALGFTISGFGLSSGTGRFGTNALLRNQYGNGNDGTITPAIISRKCDKLVVGFSTRGQFAINAQFCYGSFVNFSIVCVVNAQGAMTIKLCTGPASLAFYMDYSCSGSYPAITCDYEYTGTVHAGALLGTVPGIPWPGSLAEDYHFVELYVDVTDYMNGRAKVAVDGRTYVDESGIVTAAYLGFGSNPYDDRAKLDRVNLYVRSSANLGNSGGPAPLYFDSLYLSDDQGGYQDDFLGDIFVKTAYPVSDGTEKRNWIPYLNSTQQADDYPHHELIDDAPIQPGDELTYLEADLDLTEEMVGFGTDPIPAGSELIAVNHRTLFRNVAIGGTPKMNSLVPLIQMLGNPIVRTDSLAKKLVGWSYSFLDVMYPIVPVSAELWQEYLLEGVEFGFLIRNAEGFIHHLEDIGIADEVWDTEFDWDLMPDGLDFTDEAIDSIGLLMLFFAGADEATTWVEDSHDYDPDYSDGAEIDTAQFYVGSSSVKLVARDGQPSGFGYVVPGITPSITQTVFFRFHGIDDYFGIFLGDTDEGEVFFDFAIEARDGSRYYWIGAGNADGDIGTPFTDECLLAADTWHKVKMIVNGRDITVEVNDVEVVSWTASIDNPLSGLGYVEFQNANDVAGNDVWIGSAVIRE